MRFTNKTPEQRERRLQVQRKQQRRRRQHETPERRQHRLAQQKQRRQQSRGPSCQPCLTLKSNGHSPLALRVFASHVFLVSFYRGSPIIGG